MMSASPDAARVFVETADFYWHQRFELAPGVYAPGVNDVERLLGHACLPESIAGTSVLDIGTANGGVAFELARRGATRVVAVDIYDSGRFGFEQIRKFLGVSVEYLCCSVYELAARLGGEQFDIVIFFGVLYHLRHPLLALDALRSLVKGRALIETAVCDYLGGGGMNGSVVYFHRLDNLNKDASNWFEPSVAAVTDWCRSSGLEPACVKSWPDEAPGRCMVTAIPSAGAPEYLGLSYELPLKCTIADGYRLPGELNGMDIASGK